MASDAGVRTWTRLRVMNVSGYPLITSPERTGQFTALRGRTEGFYTPILILWVRFSASAGLIFMLRPFLNVLNHCGVFKDKEKMKENDPSVFLFGTAGWRGDLRSGSVAPPWQSNQQTSHTPVWRPPGSRNLLHQWVHKPESHNSHSSKKEVHRSRQNYKTSVFMR